MKLRALFPSTLALTFALAIDLAGAADPSVIFDMDTVRHQPTTVGQDKVPIGTVELVEGKVGSACRFSFGTNNQSGFFTASVRPAAAWDQAAGLSFWVKGDGSKSWGGLEMIDGSDYALRYGYCFPIDSTEWRKITVAWRDLVPELPKGPLVDGKAGYAPSRFGNLWFGKWYYWRDFPSCSFAVDQVSLEPSIDLDSTDYTPARAGTPRLLAKLKARQAVTIVTMGDSLTDKRHWANRDVLWAELLAARLKEVFSVEVKLVNPAIGGTQLTQNLVLMPRWLQEAPEPDLVTVWFGYNDWDSGARGPDWRDKLRFAVDRIRRMTRGRSDVLLLTTAPALDRWSTMDELADATRAVAAEKKTALADVAGTFHEQGAEEARRAALFAWDKTHLGEAGHRLAAETAFQAISRPVASVQAFDYTRKEIYHSPERPGYTSWAGLWLARDGRLQCSFTQITGPKEKPVSTVVVLESRDEGQTWTRVQGDIPLGGGRGMVVLEDGTLVRPQWPDGADGTGCVRRSSDGGKTWSDRVELMPPAAYRVWPTVIRPLRDGRLVLNAGVWKRGDGDVPNPRMTKMMFVSGDEGRSWGEPIVLMPTELGVCEESDACELPGGDLFWVHRAEHFPQEAAQIPPGAARMGEPFPNGYSDRLQSVVRKTGDAWEPGPPEPAPFPHSGFPDVLMAQEGVILHLATDGIYWTADVGKTWQRLPLDGTGYYPRSVQLPGGKIVCIGHVGGDDVYGTVDQSIVQQTFRLKVAP